MINGISVWPKIDGSRWFASLPLSATRLYQITIASKSKGASQLADDLREKPGALLPNKTANPNGEDNSRWIRRPLRFR